MQHDAAISYRTGQCYYKDDSDLPNIRMPFEGSLHGQNRSVPMYCPCSKAYLSAAACVYIEKDKDV